MRSETANAVVPLHPAQPEELANWPFRTITASFLPKGENDHDDAHNAFMTLPPHTRIREGEEPQLGMARNLLAGPLHEEMPSQKLYKISYSSSAYTNRNRIPGYSRM